MLRTIFFYITLASIASMLSGCADPCPKSLTDGVSDLKTKSDQANKLPQSNKAEITAKVAAFDKVVQQCKKLVNDNKAHAGCALEGGRWDMEGDKRSCDSAESALTSLKSLI